MNPELVIGLAEAYGYRLELNDEKHKFVRFKNETTGIRIDVWYTTGTIGKYLPHKPGVYYYNKDLVGLESILEEKYEGN